MGLCSGMEVSFLPLVLPVHAHLCPSPGNQASRSLYAAQSSLHWDEEMRHISSYGICRLVWLAFRLFLLLAWQSIHQEFGDIRKLSARGRVKVGAGLTTARHLASVTFSNKRAADRLGLEKGDRDIVVLRESKRRDGHISRKTRNAVFYSPCIQLPRRKKSEVKMEIYTVFQKLWKEKDSYEGFLFLGFVYKEQSSCWMKSIVGTVIINSPRIILRYCCRHISLRGKKNYGYM